MLFDLVGSAGVFTLLLAYGLMQTGKLRADGWQYSGLNLLGSVAVMVSLMKDWNFAAFVLEAAWGAISIYGIVKSLTRPTPQ